MILTWTASGAGGHAGERVCSRAGAEATGVGVRGAALPSARFPGRSRGWTLDRAWVFRASRYPIGPSASGWVVGAVGRGSFCLGTGSLRVRVALVVGPECKGGMWTRDRVSERTDAGDWAPRSADGTPGGSLPASRCSQVLTGGHSAHRCSRGRLLCIVPSAAVCRHPPGGSPNAEEGGLASPALAGGQTSFLRSQR